MSFNNLFENKVAYKLIYKSHTHAHTLLVIVFVILLFFPLKMAPVEAEST